MTIDDCGRLIQSLFKEYLPKTHYCWEIEFFYSKEIAGRVYPYHKVLQISRDLLEYGTYDQIKDVILHEIAHAIASTIDDRHSEHDELWKSICHSVGCSGDLTVHLKFEKPSPNNSNPTKATLHETLRNYEKRKFLLEIYKGIL
jgi:predicted SprT family Zn-dependent metalloprotease